MRKTIVPVIAASLFAATAAWASVHSFDFNSDPAGILTIIKGEEANSIGQAGAWFPTDGSPLEVGTNPSTNGYLQITAGDPTGPGSFGHRAVIIFDDFDDGLVVAAFKFQCDLRIGAGTANPADGFSLNYARGDDPVILNNDGTGFAASPGNEGNLPEEGTQTGLSICFDAWDSGSGDVIGLTIRVDNVIRTNIAMPTRNGTCTDITSMQTGTNTLGLAGLCWAPLSVELTTDGRLSVSYKGALLVDNYQVNFAPSPGRLIFAGRVGGSNQYQDVDNIRLETTPSALPVVGPTTANANGFKLNISDSGFATPDTNTITATLDGAPVTFTSMSQSGNVGGGNGVTAISYQNPSLLLAAGSSHTNIIEFTGSTFSGTVRATNIFTIPNYTILTSADKAPGTVNTSLPGFSGRIHQLPVGRFPGDQWIALAEKQMADGIIDPDTGLPYESITVGGVSTFTTDGWINYYDKASQGQRAGNFNSLATATGNIEDEPFPGIDPETGNDNNFTVELITILDLPVGAYELGVNHDDGYKLSYGPEPRNFFDARVLASSNGNADNTGLRIVVTNGGFYPVRLLLAENGGDAQLEFYLVDFATGKKILINDLTTGPTSIAAYRDTAALTQPYVFSVAPIEASSYAVPGNNPIVVKFKNGSAGTVTTGSVRIDDQVPTISSSGSDVTATLAGNLPPGIHTAKLVYNTSLGGPFTNTWTFSVYSSKTNVVRPGDAIVAYQPNGGSSPDAEGVANAIGGNLQKYLNFGNGQAPIGPLGFVVTPSLGATIVTGLRHYSANDAPERDPAYVVLEGSVNDGATWNPIYSGAIAMATGRNGSGDAPVSPATNFVSEVSFPNTYGYSSYRWYTTALRGNPNLMQISEVEFLGSTGPLAPYLTIAPSGTSVIITASQAGTLQASPSLSGGWTNVGPISTSLTLPHTAPALFYRLQTP